MVGLPRFAIVSSPAPECGFECPIGNSSVFYFQSNSTHISSKGFLKKSESGLLERIKRRTFLIFSKSPLPVFPFLPATGTPPASAPGGAPPGKGEKGKDSPTRSLAPRCVKAAAGGIPGIQRFGWTFKVDFWSGLLEKTELVQIGHSNRRMPNL
jgi:hypothetical protein